jgi:hypothetical protein
MKRRILHKIKLEEISAVDRPAQAHAKAVILKAGDDDDDDGDARLFHTRADLAVLAKRLIETGETAGVDGDTYNAEIAKRAQAAFPSLSREQRFTKYITEDATGKLLFKASTMAARSVAQAAQNLGPEPKSFGPAGAELNRLATEMGRAKSLTMQEAFRRLLTDPSRADLVRRSKEESRRATDAATRQRWPLWNGEKESQTKEWLGRR